MQRTGLSPATLRQTINIHANNDSEHASTTTCGRLRRGHNENKVSERSRRYKQTADKVLCNCSECAYDTADGGGVGLSLPVVRPPDSGDASDAARAEKVGKS